MSAAASGSVGRIASIRARGSWWGWGVSILFVGLWLLPSFYQGCTGETIQSLPPFLTNLQRNSCLFMRRVPAWAVWHIQVLLQGQEEWREIDVRELSSLEPFGHHTRLDLMLKRTGQNDVGLAQRQAIASYVREKFRERTPDTASDVGSVRFVKVTRRSSPELAGEVGAWTKPPLERSVSRGEARVLSIHTFDGRPAKLVDITLEGNPANAVPRDGS